MIILPPDEWKLSYLCPACGNLYYGSTMCSYTVFGATHYSDGSCIPNGPAMTWVTECPRCNQYFAKEYLFPIPHPVTADEIPKEILDRPWRNEGSNFGYVDGAYSENSLVFWENVVQKGLYFPMTAYKWDREAYTTRAYKELWYRYNRHRDEISEEIYSAHCRRLIDMLNERHEDALLPLAELYRNLGDFEKSEALLFKVPINEKSKAHVLCIKEELKKHSIRTAVIPPINDNF